MSILLIIFVSMLLAWNAVSQPEWCKSFWEWVSSIGSSKKTKKEETVTEGAE